ncbi:MAG: short-chain dehydrogenase [Nitrosospira sp. 56-18]|nr:SDR family NAD(P)-dependent oxidoreductase [Nitrosospira sp.]OJY15528.1 MAG: short-chain dehydrogenase [Nitrosospira sp. 56-18]
MNKGICVIVGAGPGNGAAMGAEFAATGYRVVLCARSKEKLNAIAEKIPGASTYAYDVRDTQATPDVFARIRAEVGPVGILIYNAGAGAFKNVDNSTLEDFQSAWEVNCRGLFLAVKEVLPDMRTAGKGSIIVIGATASIKGGANFAPFASAKAGQRGLVQSLARHLGPEKIHVSYVILDGVVNLQRTRQQMPDKADEFFLEPSQIAKTVLFLAQQPTQAWSFELDLRPFGEKW